MPYPPVQVCHLRSTGTHRSSTRNHIGGSVYIGVGTLILIIILILLLT